jgi:hypothetical protein
MRKSAEQKAKEELEKRKAVFEFAQKCGRLQYNNKHPFTFAGLVWDYSEAFIDCAEKTGVGAYKVHTESVKLEKDMKTGAYYFMYQGRKYWLSQFVRNKK